jgi:hypothetical protein
MPRTDVPAPGQGKRGRRKAWRDNADQAIAIYGLTAEETPNTIAMEEEMSQAFPYWDDDIPQPQSQSQSQSPQQTYTKEEAQELVEMAYQEGWQQGMEEGYKLGKDKGYKEYKEVQEEEEAKKAAATYKDNRDTPCIATKANATTQTGPTAPKACGNAKTMHTTPSSSISSITATNDSHLLSAFSRDATSSISPTASMPISQIIEIIDSAAPSSPILSNNTQASHLDTRNLSNDVSDCYIVSFDPRIVPSSNQSDQRKNRPLDTPIPESIQNVATTATRELRLLSSAPRDSTSSIPSTSSLKSIQNIEIDNSAAYNIPTSPDTIQNTYLHTGNTYSDLSDPYVVFSDPRIAPSSCQNSPEKNHSLHTPIPEIREFTTRDVQNEGNTLSLVDVDIQEPPPASETSPDTEKSPPAALHTPTLPPRQPLLPSMQLLNPTPYKRVSGPSEMSYTPTEPNSDSSLHEKPTTAHQSGQLHTPEITLTNTSIAATENHLPSSAAPSFIIHTQTVIVNNYYQSIDSPIGKNGTTVFSTTSPTPPKNTSRTGNSEDIYRAPASPTTQSMAPRDLSVLRSCHRRPFSSLHRRSRRRQSMPVRGHNWNSNLDSRIGQTPHALGWGLPTGIYY